MDIGLENVHLISFMLDLFQKDIYHNVNGIISFALNFIFLTIKITRNNTSLESDYKVTLT